MSTPDKPVSPPAQSEVFARVVHVIRERQAGRGMTNPDGKSYVRSLLEKGENSICEKIAEETMELCAALRNESDERVANEAADLLFHVFVGLVHRNIDLNAVEQVFSQRFGMSGIDEKAARKQ